MAIVLRSDLSLNLSGPRPDIETQARFHEANGMDMVILQGTTGEWPSLSTPERLAMAAAWRQAVPPGSHMKLILHVGHDSLVDAQLLAQRAVSLEMDAVLISAPSKFIAHTVTHQAQAVVDIMAHCGSIPAFYCARGARASHTSTPHVHVHLTMPCDVAVVLARAQITIPISMEIALTCTSSWKRSRRR